jgi:hypothetical protein
MIEVESSSMIDLIVINDFVDLTVEIDDCGGISSLDCVNNH